MSTRMTTILKNKRVCTFLRLVAGGSGAETTNTENEHTHLFSRLVAGGSDAKQSPASKTSAYARFGVGGCW